MSATLANQRLFDTVREVAVLFSVSVLGAPQSVADSIAVTSSSQVASFADATISLCFSLLVDSLVRGEPCLKIEHVCRKGILLVESWMFARDVRYRRSRLPADQLWATMHVCVTSLWLLRNPRCKQAKLIGNMLAPCFRDLFWRRSALSGAGGNSLVHVTAMSWVSLQKC